MSGSTILFYMLAGLILGSGLLSVTTRQLFRAAIYLLFSLIGMAGMYFWMEYDFIAAVQIVVYVGGITVLIIFSIFLTQQAGELLPQAKFSRSLFSALASFCAFALVMIQILGHTFPTKTATTVDPNVKNIGYQMLGVNSGGGYALPFEVVSMLLLAALVGCIIIALNQKPIKK